MSFNIVLIEPEIPNNTGNIGRLALATNSKLHLVKPFGFEITDSRLKRAGLDYWAHINLRIYDSSNIFFEEHKEEKMAFFSSQAKQTYWDIEFENNMFLIFGKESVGLSSSIINSHQDQLYNIPMHGNYIRSLNLGNAVGILCYEGLRQLNFQ